jgi:hypothetical protein
LNATGSSGRRSAMWIRHASFILMEKKRNEDKEEEGGLVLSRSTSGGLKGARSGLYI